VCCTVYFERSTQLNLTHRVIKMNKYMIGILLASGLIMVGQSVPATAAMTEGKANSSASDKGDTGEGAFMGFCMPCHGMEGKGDGPLADSLGDVTPRNFTDAEYMSTRTDDELFGVIKNGGASAGFSDAMPDWGYNFHDDEIRRIIKYIRSDLCKCKYEGDK